MAFNYSVAIKLSVNNLASQGVRMLAADLIKAHGAAVNLQGKLSALKMAAAGLAISKAGDGILGFLGKSIEASKEYTHQIALMKAAGFTQKEVADSVASAWKTTGEVVTTTAQDNLKAIRELRTAFGRGEGMGHAYAVLPQVTRIEGILQSLTGKKQEGVAFDMVKAIEFSTKGAISIQNMSKQADMMAKSLVAFNGTLTVSDFHSTFKQMASAAAYLSDDFKYNVMPTIMQEFKTATGGGAQRAGTSLATLFGLIKGQRIAPKNIQNWIDSGLISESMVIRNPHSRTMSKLLPNAIGGANLFTEHPEEFATKYLVPAMAKFKAKHKGADDLAFYYSLTGDRWSAFMMQTLVNKAQQIKRDQELIAQVDTSYTSYNKLLKTDPMLAQQALQNQWQNMQAIIGYQILPALIPAITRFAQSMAELNTWMSKNPDKLRNLVVGLAGLGLTLSVLGKVLMGVAFFKFIGALPLLGKSIGLFFDGLAMLFTPFRLLVQILPALARGALTLFTASNPIGWVLLGLAAAAWLVWNNWREIWSNLKIMFGDMVAGFRQLFNGDIMGALGSFGSVFLRGFQLILNTLIAGLNMALPKAWQVGKFNFADPAAPAKAKPMTSWSPAIPPAMSGQMVQVHATWQADGYTLAQVTSKHQAKAASRPAATSGRVDWQRIPPAMAYGGTK